MEVETLLRVDREVTGVTFKQSNMKRFSARFGMYAGNDLKMDLSLYKTTENFCIQTFSTVSWIKTLL